MSSKTTTGRGPSSKSLSGEDSSTGSAGPAGPPGPTGPAGPPGTGLAGGVAGNVPYQTAPGTTSYITNSNGVMQMVSNVPAWTDSTTTLKRVTAPAANDLDLVSSGAAKKIKLSTNAGEITLNTANGVLPDAWSIAQTTGVLTNGLNSADIVLTHGGITTSYDGGLITTSTGNFTTSTTTAASTYRVMTNGY